MFWAQRGSNHVWNHGVDYKGENQVISMYCGNAAEIRSPGCQMRPINPPGDPRSYHRGSLWRPIDSLGFMKMFWKNESVCVCVCVGGGGGGGGGDDSIDALISNVHCASVKCGPCLVHLTIFWLVAWTRQIIDWRTTQKWDIPPNHQP